MNKEEINAFVKWIMDDSGSKIYSYERQYCDNSKNVYNYDNQNHSCYFFKDKIEYIDFEND